MATKHSDWEIRPYRPEDIDLWDTLCRASRNATFLFERKYMDYHADRFSDASLVAMFRGRPAALLPAETASDGTLRSHGGLTYGGWILPFGHIDGADVLRLFDEWLRYSRSRGYSAIDYRPVPYIYHRAPSQDDLYALFRLGARQTSCAISSTIDMASHPGLNTMQRRHLRKALALDPQINECTDIGAFHAMLAECLRMRHDTEPVHTADELRLLHSRFPENIRLHTISAHGRMQAGVCIYLTHTTAHAQYIATTPEGRSLNMLTPLMASLINLYSHSRRYFDFGISTEDGGFLLNEGLLRQKSSYGASPTVYQRFILDL